MNEAFLYSQLLERVFAEDLPDGDATSDPIIDPKWVVTASLKAKEDLVLSGSHLFQEAMLWQDPELKLNWYFQDSAFVYERQTICQIEGPALPILKAERVALNFLGKLSGIATLTRCFVEKIEGTKASILDTRKTTPGFRELEKKAVRDGGGKNHRMSLSDAVLIKDNHIRAAGSITSAVEKIRKSSTPWIEVECSTMEEVKEAVGLSVQRLLLDNMNLDLMKACLAIIPPEIETEASGNMTLDRVKDVAKLGVKYISVGQITHSAPTADMSLLFDWGNADEHL